MPAPSMICRGKNLHLASLKHFVDSLPRVDMPKADFFAYAEARMESFSKTHSQIARQLGLYYCDGSGICHSRFKSDPSFDEICRYARYWAEHYYVPNPYTPSFPQGCTPKCIYGYVVENCSAANGDLRALFQGLFNAPMADTDKARSYLVHLSELIENKDWFVIVPENAAHVPSSISLERNDVEGFYHHFDGWMTDAREASNEDGLTVALKMFAQKRNQQEWCADNTIGNTVELRVGYVANAKLRAALPMTNNLGTDVQVVQWFKDYVYPDGKGWLDGIDTNGCAAFGGYINYLVTGGAAVARPAKFTRSLESAVKAIVKPASECFYNKDIHAVLKYLGLVGFDFKEDFDEDDYQDALHAQRVIKRRLKDMGEKQIVEWDAAANQAKPNGKEPDFLTVNEFLWFVKENKQEISRIAKEKAMAKQQKKPTKDKVTTGKATISELLANKEDSLMTMLTAALLTKPLVILAGVSGTGKSRMVRHLAYKTCLDKDLQPQGGNAPGNFKMIQVKPNWHDSADLLGYRSVVSGNHEFVTTEFVKFVLKAHAYPDTPFFVCLDEMNLAPVEHYFAEFLSACESIRKNEQGVWISDPIVSPTDFDGEIINLGGDVKFESDDAPLDAALKARKALIEKEGLFIPRNLFVVGTVNMDDTTNGFSRKVLDRAMTIEMNEVKFDELQKKDEGLSAAAANVFKPEEIKKFIDREDFDGLAMLNDEFRDQMEALRGKLEKSPFALAYRFARETTLYRKALMTILNPAEVVKDASGAPKKDAASTPIDAERACGEIALDHMILMKVLPRFTGTVTERETIIKDVGEYLDALIKDKKVGKVKLDDMVERAKHNGGYLSFWP